MNERFARAGAVARIDLTHERDFALGAMQVRPSLREISGTGWVETIDPRVMQVLIALARAGGKAVSRDDLIESCWDGLIVSEDAINRCIGRLRKVGEASGNAFAVETIPRVGYRLKVAKTEAAVTEALSAEAQEASAVPATPAAAAASSPVSIARPSRSIGTKKIGVVSAVAALVLLMAGFALWRFWPAKPPSTPIAPVEASVAVLPFVNMSGDPKQEYFSDGFSEELINDLANVPHLLVASRTSAFAFKGRSENIETMAHALNVRAIVEGSIRESGDRVRITAQLIDARDGYHLWSADYTRNMTDILVLQDDLARAIASALTHQLVPAPARPRPRIDPAVYRLFLEGIREYETPVTGWRRAFAIFKQVTARAPEFADGFVWLSRAAGDLAASDPSPEIAILGLNAEQKALVLDPRNLWGRVERQEAEVGGWDWAAAAADLRIIQNQNPDAYASIDALWNHYMILGNADEAFAAWQRLPTTDPYTWHNNFISLIVLDEAGRFRQEIAMARAQLASHPRDGARLDHLCVAYAALGQIAAAQGVEERLRSVQADFDSQSAAQDCEWYIDMASGNRTDASRIMNIWEQEFPDKMVQASPFGSRYVVMGDFDKASEWFERAYERRETYFFADLFLAGLIMPSFTSLEGFGYGKAFAAYRMTPGYKALAAKPLFREWQAEHDRIAAAHAAHKDPLN